MNIAGAFVFKLQFGTNSDIAMHKNVYEGY